ncbi:sodium:solute symporter family protein [Sphingomonas nostoxanthinifaciens]|uniref:sodium:solute symporter family protein n=1 Tax=Sphingomonas nostoxanthinifaciens TaxID=2872652 RepID=UPI001CC1D895|nr:sodium:solute symporter family protein [Sphingomonas nostoxanthinifaciens]UAK22914.1 sodium:solute symporter family protein [Sphingomonas nostoxanthinifaciens]
MIVFVAGLVLLATMAGAIIYGRRQARAQSVEEWAIGGRRLGLLIFWFVNAGEIYTTFAVLGISGFAWAYGAPAYLSFTSVSLASAVAYWLMPRVWAAGRRDGLVTQADFFATRYYAPWLGVVVAIAGLFATIVYVEVQLTALSLVLQLTVGAGAGKTLSVILAAVLMLAFVFLAGLRSAAFAAGVKDVLMILLVVALSLTVAGRMGATSLFDVFARAEALRPGIGAFPGAQPAAGLSTTWFITSALNVAASTWFFPHMFQLSYAASGPRALRQNAIWQPLYSLSYFFIILLGFAVLVAGVQPPAGDPNAALLTFVAQRYPAWLVGLMAGTACLLALVPGSVLLMTSGTIFARNIVAPLTGRHGDDLRISRLSMIGFAAIAVYLTLGASQSIVKVGLSAYASIGMLAPGAVLALIWPQRARASGVLAGLAVGYCALLLPAAQALWKILLPEWEPGLIALALNLATVLLVGLAAPRAAGQPAGA